MTLFLLHDSKATGVSFGEGDRYDQTDRPINQRLRGICSTCYRELALPRNCETARHYRAELSNDKMRDIFHRHTHDTQLAVYTNFITMYLASQAGLQEWLCGKLHAAQCALEADDTAAVAQVLATMQARKDGVVA